MWRVTLSDGQVKSSKETSWGQLKHYIHSNPNLSISQLTLWANGRTIDVPQSEAGYLVSTIVISPMSAPQTEYFVAGIIKNGKCLLYRYTSRLELLGVEEVSVNTVINRNNYIP